MQEITGALRQMRAVELADWLSSYRPRTMDSESWAAVEPFVLDCATRLNLTRSAGAVRMVRVLTRLAAWSLAEGLPLHVEVVLDPDNVERFVASGAVDDRSRATYRSVLRRVGPLLTTKAPWEPRPASVARRQVATPYSDHELALLRRDVETQSSERRRRAARALLALGAGVGLDGRWIARVRADDVATSALAVTVQVGEPSPRVVPVLARWESEVLELAESAGDEFLVGGHSLSRNRAGALAASLEASHGHPRLSAARLRSTWLVSHLRMGTRLPELTRAAGLVGATVLSDLLEYVPALCEPEAAEMLRGQR